MAKITLTAAQLSQLLKKAGLESDEQFKKLLEAENDTDVSDELFKRIGDALISLPDASNHPEIQKAVKDAVFRPTEEKLTAMLKDAGLTEADIKTLLDGKPNAEKIAVAGSKLQELAKAGVTKGLTDQQTEWIKKQSEYEAQITDWQSKYTQLETARENDTLHHGLDAFLLHSGKVKLRSDLPMQTQLRMVKEELLSQSNGKGVLKVVNGKLQLMDKNEPSKPYFEPGNTNAFDWEEFAVKSVTDLGLVEKQPGKTEVITTRVDTQPANDTYRSAIDTNHAFIENAIKQ